MLASVADGVAEPSLRSSPPAELLLSSCSISRAGPADKEDEEVEVAEEAEEEDEDEEEEGDKPLPPLPPVGAATAGLFPTSTATSARNGVPARRWL
jgi:hypothetical protein